MVANVENVELTGDELEALAVLTKILVEIDDFVTIEESDEMALVAKEVGEDAFWQAFDKIRQREIGVPEIAEYAGKVSRRPAQELIYALLEELADADGVGKGEGVILERIRHSWSLED